LQTILQNELHSRHITEQKLREEREEKAATEKMLMEHMNKKVDQSQELREARATNKKLMKAIEEKEKQ
jgi:hypothetical protein